MPLTVFPPALGSLVAVIPADHRTQLAGGEALVLLAVPVLWMLGVVLVILHKFRAH